MHNSLIADFEAMGWKFREIRSLGLFKNTHNERIEYFELWRITRNGKERTLYIGEDGRKWGKDFATHWEAVA